MSARIRRHVVVTASESETAALGGRLAAALEPGDVVTVAGDLGSGKTAFVRGASRALGVAGAVTSPTYTIGHLYDAPVPVAHLDLYRRSGPGAEDLADLEPYFNGTIAFVEWPEHAACLLQSARVAVGMEHVDETHRRITIEHEDDLRL